MDDQLTLEERSRLLELARLAIQSVLCGETLAPLDLSCLPTRLREQGASFVTLTCRDELRGCIGTLEPYLPLAEDVRRHAVSAATEDYRFPPILPEELAEVTIEISRLSPQQPLPYDCPEDLPRMLRPGIDGVTLRDGFMRATFLPQVWEKIPDPVLFLSHLCQKMGAPVDLWRYKKLNVQVYQVEEFQEESQTGSGLVKPAQSSPH